MDGIADEGSGNTTTFDQTLLKASLNVVLRFTCLIDAAFFLVKRTTSGLGTTLLKCGL